MAYSQDYNSHSIGAHSERLLHKKHGVSLRGGVCIKLNGVSLRGVPITPVPKAPESFRDGSFRDGTTKQPKLHKQ